VALVERELLGGTCLNRGCIPTKTMIASAKVASQVRRARTFGVETTGPTVHLAEVVDRKDTVVDTIRSGSYRAVAKTTQAEGVWALGDLRGGAMFTHTGRRRRRRLPHRFQGPGPLSRGAGGAPRGVLDPGLPPPRGGLSDRSPAV
jgi:pyruvate/2-oxoglutarate dehydrogenase complex dihydrolipoamide dehydrogenase (E3) component